jgi:uncharacterized membrane protein YcfT
MFAAIFAFIYGLLIFALVAEADSQFLIITGIVAAVWMVLAGMFSGIQSFKK